MRILVTNDDGIHAPGLKVAEKIARSLGSEVWVVAPETDQSGVSHSLSLNDPLRLREISPYHFAAKGTPTDCVLMACKHIMRDKQPDLVISGVNRGQNIAEDVTYSGTVAAAMEATTLGIPAFALSQAYGFENRLEPPYATAEKLAPELLKQILSQGFPKGVLMNINFPNRDPKDVHGTKVTVQGFRDQEMLKIDARYDGRGNPYYWLAFARGNHTIHTGTDYWAITEGYVSVTPLRLDLTDTLSLSPLRALLEG